MESNLFEAWYAVKVLNHYKSLPTHFFIDEDYSNIRIQILEYCICFKSFSQLVWKLRPKLSLVTLDTVSLLVQSIRLLEYITYGVKSLCQVAWRPVKVSNFHRSLWIHLSFIHGGYRKHAMRMTFLRVFEVYFSLYRFLYLIKFIYFSTKKLMELIMELGNKEINKYNKVLGF